jgi:16S rRNA (cytidine1402-2'-O)-methyltransferase
VSADADGCLWVVATPIGNLGDLTPRAAEILANADLVLCEDTRHTAVLLQHLGQRSQSPMVRKECWSLHAHNEVSRLPAVLERLQQGAQVALVSDAGTPCLSDPGALLVDAVHAAGRSVRTLPGPFAVAAALAGSGLTPIPFGFWGFVPKRAGELRDFLRTRLLPGPDGPMTHACYVPGRDLREVTGAVAEVAPAARVVVARELTKLHEGWLRGTAAEVQAALTEPQLRGEAVVLVEVREAPTPVELPDPVVLVREAKAAGRDRKQALADIGRRTGQSRNALYRLWQEA